MADEERKDYRSLGEILRDAREAKSQSVEDLAGQTKITPKSIRAIERDDLDQLAGPVYARGFVRTLAEAHGLDAELLLEKLVAALASMAPVQTRVVASPETPLRPTLTVARTEPITPELVPGRDEGTWRVEQVRVHRVEPGPRRPWLWWAIGTLGLIGLAVGLWSVLGFGRQGTPPALPQETAPLISAATDPGPPPGLTEASRVRTPDTMVTERSPSQAASRPPVAKPEPETTPLAAATTVETPVGSTVAEPEDATPSPEVATPNPAEESGESRRNRLPSIVRPPETERREMSLIIEARGRVDLWVGADGGDRKRHQLGGGDTMTFHARDHFSILLSDPRAVIVRLDGLRRDPPSGLRGEWILYPELQ